MRLKQHLSRLMNLSNSINLKSLKRIQRLSFSSIIIVFNFHWSLKFLVRYKKILTIEESFVIHKKKQLKKYGTLSQIKKFIWEGLKSIKIRILKKRNALRLRLLFLINLNRFAIRNSRYRLTMSLNLMISFSIRSSTEDILTQWKKCEKKALN